ncbi:hypothetical protein [Streptomyces syringium]|uniref:hypothetical protein n=1 Tax=Streptomyces syringium TaxID=76729 RepID=UPI0037D5B9E4
MDRALARLGAMLCAAMILLTVVASPALAGTKPPGPIPKELDGQTVGVSKSTGEYCNRDDSDLKKRDDCMPLKGGEFPGTAEAGSEGTGASKERRLEHEREQLEKWRKKHKEDKNYEALNKFMTPCVDKGSTFQDCMNEGEANSLPRLKTPVEWAAGKLSQMASNALQEAAGAIGESVVWLLDEFAKAFDQISRVQLSTTGIGPVLGITTGLSVLIAAFLLLVQFSKLAVSHQGGPLVTAITGLAKWAAILAFYLVATQTALDWSDTLSTALINETFAGGGSGKEDATKAMQQQLGTLFSGLLGGGGGTAATGALITGGGITAHAIGAVIVLGILCILAVGMLWVEMLLRQAGIMILVSVMPIVLAGQMADSTREWWPKARNALIALILMKPVIVLCFAIGFKAMSGGQGIRNVLVGLIIFIIAGFAWPVIAKFMVFTSNGSGNSAASALMSSVGSSVSSMFGGNQPALSGAGTVGGGSGYTQALEADNTSATGGGSGGFWSNGKARLLGNTSGSFGSKVGGAVGLGLQVAAVGKDMLETTGTNTAAHAGLDHGVQGGRHVVMVPRSGKPLPADSEPEEEGPGPEESPTPESDPPPAAAPPTSPAQTTGGSP